MLISELVEMHVGVSIHGGCPEWMVYNGKHIKIGDLFVPPF